MTPTPTDTHHNNNINNTEKLHWRSDVPRLGLGNLIKKANHIAIVVSDVEASLHFYKDILGLQQIKRPNFDRYGAWLTMGNIELHLIKGVPAVHNGDNLIVSHISLETDNIDEVLAGLDRLGVQYSQNISVPTSDETAIVTQYFLRDPDGYYIELCNCDILTEFCMSQDEKSATQYNQNVEKVSPASILKLALLANEMNPSKKPLEELILPADQHASSPDPVKLENLLNRTKIYSDPMQGETRESISRALIEANNHVPLATRILKARKKGRVTMVPPAYYIKGQTEIYQPPSVEYQHNEQPQQQHQRRHQRQRQHQRQHKHQQMEEQKHKQQQTHKQLQLQLQQVHKVRQSLTDLREEALWRESQRHNAQQPLTDLSGDVREIRQESLLQSLRESLGPSFPKDDNALLLKERAQKILEQLCTNPQGVIFVEELKGLLQAICQGISEEVLQKMIREIDRTGNGCIGIDEICQLLSTHESDLEVQAFFNLLDDDQNGRITLPELAKALTSIGVMVTDEQVEEIYTEGDLDGDGALNPQELAKLLSSCGSIDWQIKSLN